eukprot:COSAG05_NODE_10285_length_573_cov_1.746835_1_plen_59_part_00
MNFGAHRINWYNLSKVLNVYKLNLKDIDYIYNDDIQKMLMDELINLKRADKYESQKML